MTNWKTSAKGNPYFKDGNFLVTVYESKRKPGFCYCVSNDEENIKIFSNSEYPGKIEVMSAAVKEYTMLQEVPEPEEEYTYPPINPADFGDVPL